MSATDWMSMWIVLGFFYVAGFLGFPIFFGIEASLATGEARSKYLRLALSAPIWPLVALVAGIRSLPRFGRWVAGIWREAWPPKPEPKPVARAGWDYTRGCYMTINEARQAMDPEPLIVKREEPTPGQWEQPR